MEDDQLELARRLEKVAAEKGVKLYLASDIVVADRCVSCIVYLLHSVHCMYMHLHTV